MDQKLCNICYEKVIKNDMKYSIPSSNGSLPLDQIKLDQLDNNDLISLYVQTSNINLSCSACKEKCKRDILNCNWNDLNAKNLRNELTTETGNFTKKINDNKNFLNQIYAKQQNKLYSIPTTTSPTSPKKETSSTRQINPKLTQEDLKQSHQYLKQTENYLKTMREKLKYLNEDQFKEYASKIREVALEIFEINQNVSDPLKSNQEISKARQNIKNINDYYTNISNSNYWKSKQTITQPNIPSQITIQQENVKYNEDNCSLCFKKLDKSGNFPKFNYKLLGKDYNILNLEHYNQLKDKIQTSYNILIKYKRNDPKLINYLENLFGILNKLKVEMDGDNLICTSCKENCLASNICTQQTKNYLEKNLDIGVLINRTQLLSNSINNQLRVINGGLSNLQLKQTPTIKGGDNYPSLPLMTEKYFD